MSDKLPFIEDGFEALVVLQDGLPKMGAAMVARVTVEDGAVHILAEHKLNHRKITPVRATVRWEDGNLVFIIANPDDDGRWSRNFEEVETQARADVSAMLAAWDAFRHELEENHCDDQGWGSSLSSAWDAMTLAVVEVKDSAE